MATLRDPKFIAEMAKRHYTIDPISGKRITKFIKQIMATAPAKLARLRSLMGLAKKK